jgi:hypothetical protein
MKFVKAIISLIVTGALIYVLNRPLGPAPALGPFLSPFTGFWQNGEEPADPKGKQVLKLAGLKDEVTIRFDDTGVPHIFAKTTSTFFTPRAILPPRTACGKWICRHGLLLEGFPRYWERLHCRWINKAVGWE